MLHFLLNDLVSKYCVITFEIRSNVLQIVIKVQNFPYVVFFLIKKYTR